jgi:hypothetical protein
LHHGSQVLCSDGLLDGKDDTSVGLEVRVPEWKNEGYCDCGMVYKVRATTALYRFRLRIAQMDLSDRRGDRRAHEDLNSHDCYWKHSLTNSSVHTMDRQPVGTALLSHQDCSAPDYKPYRRIKSLLRHSTSFM